MRQQRGFVLINALIIVAALAGAATLLLSRAETGRLRLEAGQTASQLGYYLDAFDALAIRILDADRSGGAVDHPREAWANADYNVPLDRGRVAGQITDLQSLFNLNWLNNPQNTEASETFDRLLQRKGLSPQLGTAVRQFMQSGGPPNRALYDNQSPPLDPVGGSLLLMDQLRDIPTLSDQDFDRLSEVATVLPGDSAININTADADIIVGMVPQVSAGGVLQILNRRDTRPFVSVDEFITELQLRSDVDLEEELNISRFAIGSDWFRVDSVAELDGLQATRRATLLRLGLPSGTIVRWRKSLYP